jgi:hypothetical protein
MKNLRYFPFERNIFFKGKLLTVRDFELEQKYFNDKRRLINRLLHGSGVISGLQVARVDDKQLFIQRGVALDSLGREIIVPSPVKMKLSMIEGFKNNDYAKNVYLCIAYDEKKNEQVYSVAPSSEGSSETGEYNRVLEGYRLFVKEEAPELTSFETNNWVHSQKLLYEDNQVRIWQQLPRYVNPGETFEAALHIEKTVQTGKIRFEYALESDRFALLNGEAGLISFSESLDSTDTEFTAPLILKSGSPADGVVLRVKPNSAKLTIGDRVIQLELESAGEISIIPGSVKEKIMDDYYERSLDEAIAFPSEQCVYLAKICLLQLGSTYMIEKVEKVPFGEYVYNASLLHKLSGITEETAASSHDHFQTRTILEELKPEDSPKLAVQYNDDSNTFEFKLGLPKTRKVSNELTTGVVEIALKPKTLRPFGGKAGSSSFSDEIVHGMGSGKVCITTAIEEASSDTISDLAGSNECLYFGDNEVFQDSAYESDMARMSIGTILYPKKGTFRIGVKPQTITDKETVKVRWWAVRQITDFTNFYEEPAADEAAAGKDNK